MGPPYGPTKEALQALIWFAAFGMICAAIATVAAVGFGAYHLFMALRLYLGA